MSLVTRTKTLAEILPSTAVLVGAAEEGQPSTDEIEITGISTDSRLVEFGDLFVAKNGLTHPGSQFIEDAQKRGALAVVTDDSEVSYAAGKLPLVQLVDLDKNLSAIAHSFFDAPSGKLSVTGITGTNGKTSCCYWYAWMSNQLGTACGQIGTLGAGYEQRSEQSLPSTGMTTPDAVTVQALLAEIVEAGAAAAVMEVSSHGLDQGRVEAVDFEAAIFTNLTQDHLDYHGDMDAYFAAKQSLFTRPELQRVVLNHDEKTFDALKSSVQLGVDLYSYSLEKPEADFFVRDLTWVSAGAEVVFDGRWGVAHATIPIIGKYNLANVCAVMTALLAAGFELQELVRAIQALPTVPGRTQLISNPDCPRVLIDYAHTPDAVAKVLRAVRSNVSGKLISVVGCGGDRDQGKRPMMGKYASENSDLCWFTSDNPRTEDPRAIIDAMLAGVDQNNFQIETHRDLAIEQAILGASEQDLIVVLGKGHEDYQEIAGMQHPFSDVEQVEKALNVFVETGGRE